MVVVNCWQDGRATVIQATGELDMVGAPRVRAELDQALSSADPPQLAIDLTEVPFCDSVGLGVLVSALHRVRDANGRMILVLTPGMITNLLMITNLDRHFEIAGTLGEAKAVLEEAA
jgi:anti-sigma B factor antagonist